MTAHHLPFDLIIPDDQFHAVELFSDASMSNYNDDQRCNNGASHFHWKLEQFRADTEPGNYVASFELRPSGFADCFEY